MVIMINFAPPEEGIHHQEPNTVAYYGNKELGKGTVYITENIFCWVSHKGEGFSLEYPNIFIHAVSRDVTHFPHECLFLMIDGKFSLGEVCEGAEDSDLVQEINALRVSEEEEEEDGEEPMPSELRFIPENKNMLDVMFRALTDCQALNPDPADISDDDEGIMPSFNIENGFVEEEGDEEDEGEYDMDEDQFEDAEA
ncbi:methylosome subunit pICln [Parasteatoda tepidariorum]|uniref:methylosome subunit pICln n=1 Tax=Parasteatoda tepidariorum TaxID=114398 RepID=UPI0039BC45F8